MKLLLVSDEENKFIWDHFDPEPFRGVDLILSCGDLKPEYLDFLVTMIPAPLLYIHGNHDRRLLTNPPEGCICIDDRFVNCKGLRILGLGGVIGARGADFMEYTEAQMRRRIAKRRFDLFRARGIDLLVTHTAAEGLGDLGDGYHKGSSALRKLVDTSHPRYHVHGHVHLRYGASNLPVQYGSTTIINACGYRILEV